MIRFKIKLEGNWLSCNLFIFVFCTNNQAATFFLIFNSKLQLDDWPMISFEELSFPPQPSPLRRTSDVGHLVPGAGLNGLVSMPRVFNVETSPQEPPKC